MEKRPGAPKPGAAKPKPSPSNTAETVAPENAADDGGQTDLNATAALDNGSLPADHPHKTASFEYDEPSGPSPGEAPKPAPNKAAPAKPAAEGKVSTLGDFKLLKKLGPRSMGAVFKAHQISLHRE